MTSRFVVVEGGDGCGKSTQVAQLVGRLRAGGHQVVATFEPGATSAGAAVRALLLETDGPLDAMTEVLLLAADRAQHVAEVVRPALERGAWVVSDRYVPSSLAYQGVGRGVGADVVATLNEDATGGLAADVVLVVDVADDVAEARIGSSKGSRGRDRLEREGRTFHDRVRAAYRELAEEYGWVVVDGNGSVDEVHAALWRAVEPFVSERA